MVVTYEPGDTKTGAELRAVLLHADTALDAHAELLLMLADRAQHVAEVVRPALERGALVVCDRYEPSTLAYQGVARGLGVDEVERLSRWAAAGVEPDVVIVLDVPDAIAEARVSADRDRFERAGDDFHARVRAAYRDLGAGAGLGARRRRRHPRRGGRARARRAGARASVGSASVDTVVVGQDRALEALQQAAARPGHAYLLVGPRGSGVEDAAREFAAMLIGVADDERGRRLVLRSVHPDVVEFEPGAASYRVKDDVRERILPEAARAPIEAERKVLILFEAERLRGNQNESANAMLKTLEEPPDRTVVVLVTGAPDDLLPTIRSRCQRIDFDPIVDADVQAALEREGVPAADAHAVAALAGGQLARARALAGPLAALRAAFASAPARVDGYGATAFAIAQELDARSTRPRPRSSAAARRSSRSSTPRWNGSATRNAMRSGCADASTSGTSARRAARASTC